MKNMLAIGNNKLRNKEDIGKTIECPYCKNTHNIKYGERVLKDGRKVPSKLLAYYNCGKKSYLAGIDGKRIS